jgi:hypothetical protein
MSIELIGEKELLAAIDKIRIKAPAEMNTILARMAFDTQQSAVISIQTSPASGRTYRRGSITHIASSPGNAPRTDTGELVRNITLQTEGFADYTVGSRRGAPQGFWMEFGTRNILPRPWLSPAYNKTLSKVNTYINQAIL